MKHSGTYSLFIYVLLFALYGCSSGTGSKPKAQKADTPATENNNDYLKKYAGAYSISVKGMQTPAPAESSEVYYLSDNGIAKYQLVQPDGKGGSKILEEKTGTWSATETKIAVTTLVGEDSSTNAFILQDGVFVEESNNENYLKPYPDKK